MEASVSTYPGKAAKLLQDLAVLLSLKLKRLSFFPTPLLPRLLLQSQELLRREAGPPSPSPACRSCQPARHPPSGCRSHSPWGWFLALSSGCRFFPALLVGGLAKARRVLYRPLLASPLPCRRPTGMSPYLGAGHREWPGGRTGAPQAPCSAAGLPKEGAPGPDPGSTGRAV